MKKVLVTGGYGFIGSHLVNELLIRGCEVRILDNGRNPAPWPRSAVVSNLGDLRPFGLRVGDFDTVFHLAAVSRTPWAMFDPVGTAETNVLGTVQLLEHVRSACPRARFVYASSNIVYGSHNPYKASKVAAEHFVDAYRACYRLNAITLRYSNVYGPGMGWNDPIVLASMRKSAAENGYITIYGDGKQWREWTHVTDIVAGTIAAADSDYLGTLDLTSGYRRSVLEMAKFFGVPIRFQPARAGDTFAIQQDPTPAYESLRWKARITPEEGIRDVLAEMPKKTEALA